MLKIGLNKLKTIIIIGFTLFLLFPNTVISRENQDLMPEKANIYGIYAKNFVKEKIDKKETKKLKVVKILNVTAYAYSSTPSQTNGSPYITASGKHVYDGLIAANWLPFGTQIRIQGLYGKKIFTVDDRMNPRHGYGYIDIWMDKPISELKKFGIKKIKIEILQT